MRLDRYLANAGAGSRKEAAAFIRAGRVAIGGAVVRDPACETKGNPVTLDGEEVLSGENAVLMMNKPAGYLSALEDKRDKTVAELLNPPYSKMKLSIVGRLDKDTEGLLLLTTDGEFAHKVTSPKYKVPKVYYLETDLPITEKDAEAIAHGVSIGEGEPVTGILKPNGGNSATLTITEGKFHQVKRMLFAVEKEVTYLKRIAIGKLFLDENKLKKGEIARIQAGDVL